MTEKLLFITDSMKGLKPKKDTSIFMMEESISMGYKVFQCEMKDLIYEDHETSANLYAINDPSSHPQLSERVDQSKLLCDIDYIFMRKDPPVDEDYMNALHLLSQAETEGANIVLSLIHI